VQAVVERGTEADGQITLARFRDEFGTLRKDAQALLEALDAARVKLRLPDDRRVLRQRRRPDRRVLRQCRSPMSGSGHRG
jgi:hypothetical protein